MKRLVFFIILLIFGVLIAYGQDILDNVRVRSMNQMTDEEINLLKDRYKEQYDSLRDDTTIRIISFVVVLLLLLYPLDAMEEAGITMENLAVRFLGVAEPDIVQYQSRRIVFNRLICGCLPFLFAFFNFFTQQYSHLFAVVPSATTYYLSNAAFFLMIVTLLYYALHSLTNYYFLSAMQQLRSYEPDINLAQALISSELLHIDTVKIRISSSERIFITPTWILHASNFSFTILKLEDVELHVVVPQERSLIGTLLNARNSDDLITVLIKVPRHLGKDILIKDTNSYPFLDHNVLRQRVIIPPGLERRYSAIQRFIKKFKAEIVQNPRYVYERINELDVCHGCSTRQPTVKLTKHCDNSVRLEGQNECSNCLCRPFWCHSCVARMFAYKQDNIPIERWLLRQIPCPTCRQECCILDVCLIVPVDGADVVMSDEED